MLVFSSFVFDSLIVLRGYRVFGVEIFGVILVYVFNEFFSVNVIID